MSSVKDKTIHLVDSIKLVQRRVDALALDAHSILQRQESATRSRVMSVDQSRQKLSTLSLIQDELIQEALDCIENGLFRSAHVSAWQAFMDFLEEKLGSDGMKKVIGTRPGWVKFKSMEEVREEISEYQIIEVAQAVGLIRKSERKILHGMLSTRNDCAHPSSFKPDLNETLGYVSGLINRIAHLQQRPL